MNIACFDDYIRKRTKEEPNVQLLQFYREIKQRGYNGGRTAAFVHLHEYVNRIPHFAPPRLPDVFYLPSKITFLLLREKKKLTSRERKLITALCRRCPEINVATGFATQFKAMMENKEGHLLLAMDGAGNGRWGNGIKQFCKRPSKRYCNNRKCHEFAIEQRVGRRANQ